MASALEPIDEAEVEGLSCGQILGPQPSWLKLGDPHLVNGVLVREILGDWSHMPECDRPPKYILDSKWTSTSTHAFNRGPDRPWIRHPFPGKPIAELRGTQSGACAILFNGGSLANHDLNRITLPIVGMNRTHWGWRGYTGPQPDYLCIVDCIWFDKPQWKEAILAHPRVINGSVHPQDFGYRVTRHPRMTPFSLDLDRDGYVGPVPCTTGYLALQLAAYLGFTELYCLGLDLGGRHFDKTAASLFGNYRGVNQVMKQMEKVMSANGIRAWVTGNPESACTAFPHAPFEVVCG